MGRRPPRLRRGGCVPSRITCPPFFPTQPPATKEVRMRAPVESEKRPTSNPALLAWVDEMAKLCKPDRVTWCDGSPEEKSRLTQEAVAGGVLLPLDQKKLPGCYFHHSNPNDVARVEHLTFICTPTKDEAGPTNNWMAPQEAYHK